MTTLHYAAGGTFDAQDNFGPASAGFNLADVQSVDQVNALPSGTQALVWLDQANGATSDFIDQVKPFIGNPKVYGFYLTDEPDPTGLYGPQVSAADLKAESDWIHANDPGAKTYITLMDMGSAGHPDYTNSYNPQNTGIDLFGIDAYPVRTETSTPDYNMIDTHVAAAEQAGIPQDQLVPIYQAFGGGSWVDDAGGKHVMPTAAQEQQIINEWANLLPNPAFDYAYAWGSQEGDTALENSPALQAVFKEHNAQSGSAPTAPSTGGTDPSTGSDPTTGGSDPTIGGDPSTGGGQSASGGDGQSASGGDGQSSSGGDGQSASGQGGHSPDHGHGHSGGSTQSGDGQIASGGGQTSGGTGGHADSGSNQGGGWWWGHGGDGRGWHGSQDGHGARLASLQTDDSTQAPAQSDNHIGHALASHGIDLSSIFDANHAAGIGHWHW